MSMCGVTFLALWSSRLFQKSLISIVWSSGLKSIRHLLLMVVLFKQVWWSRQLLPPLIIPLSPHFTHLPLSSLVPSFSPLGGKGWGGEGQNKGKFREDCSVGGAKTHQNIILWKSLSWLKDQFLNSLPNFIWNFTWLNILSLGCKIKITWIFKKNNIIEEKWTTEDEMVGWYHWLNGHEFEQVLGDTQGQGSLACYSTWGGKETWLSDWTIGSYLSEILFNCSRARYKQHCQYMYFVNTNYAARVENTKLGIKGK